MPLYKESLSIAVTSYISVFSTFKFFLTCGFLLNRSMEENCPSEYQGISGLLSTGFKPYRTKYLPKQRIFPPLKILMTTTSYLKSHPRQFMSQMPVNVTFTFSNMFIVPNSRLELGQPGPEYDLQIQRPKLLSLVKHFPFLR